jgi:hypothetical protein
MVAIFFSGEFGVGFVLDPISEDGLLALEFAGFVVGLDPIEDGIFLILASWSVLRSRGV